MQVVREGSFLMDLWLVVAYAAFVLVAFLFLVGLWTVGTWVF